MVAYPRVLEFVVKTSFSISMSSSELFIVKENNEEKELNFLSKRPMLEFQKESHATTSRDSDPPQQLQEQEAKSEVHHESQEECNNTLDPNSIEKPSLEAVLMETYVVGDDDDGFKTPTSLDHKISITKCPPAPRKPNSFLSRKRKASPPKARTILQLDLSQEIEAVFPSTIVVDLQKKIKKSPSDNDITGEFIPSPT
ncbi:hypothetical protein POPTR_006G084700v4 [Populus trichocarpa]|jgi:hypothetical protein|uniref:Uncharacterized protein n=1 Tax=Populus trichocarpa TaxID=3694 RepID=A0ACC0ST79_POPTR|nr:hypothetical protein POPTR_006G084700v4 [Populus trichocarpa]